MFSIELKFSLYTAGKKFNYIKENFNFNIFRTGVKCS